MIWIAGCKQDTSTWMEVDDAHTGRAFKLERVSFICAALLWRPTKAAVLTDVNHLMISLFRYIFIDCCTERPRKRCTSDALTMLRDERKLPNKSNYMHNNTSKTMFIVYLRLLTAKVNRKQWQLYKSAICEWTLIFKQMKRSRKRKTARNFSSHISRAMFVVIQLIHLISRKVMNSIILFCRQTLVCLCVCQCLSKILRFHPSKFHFRQKKLRTKTSA